MWLVEMYKEMLVMGNEIKINKSEGGNIIGGNVFGNISTSINIKNKNKLFEEIDNIINEKIINPDERDKILSKLKELELSTGDPKNYSTHYQELMGIAANHISVLSPFIPALSHYLT